MVKFKESGHKYYTLDDQELISVSALMHKFEPKKNWDEIAKKAAKKQEKTLQEIKDLWEKKKVKGQEAGTLIHKMKENELLAKKGIVNIRESHHDGNFKYALQIDQLENDTIYPELMMYDLDYGICGQSDIVEIKDDYIIIRDHKTDKSIEFKAFSNAYVAPEKLIGPLAKLDNCNGVQYSLKMSLYMYLVWKANKGRFKPGKILLNWCPIERDNDGIPILYDDNGEIVEANGMPKIVSEREIEIPYRKDEVIAMLETIRKKAKAY